MRHTGKNKLNDRQKQLRITASHVFAPQRHPIKKRCTLPNGYLDQLLHGRQRSNMHVGVQQLICRVFRQRKRPFDRREIQIALFQPDLLALLLIIGLTVNNVIEPGKSHANILMQPILVRIRFICQQNILYYHNYSITNTRGKVKKYITKNITNGYFYIAIRHFLFARAYVY